MKPLLIIILSFSFTISALGQKPEYSDTGFTNKAEAKNLIVNGKKERVYVQSNNFIMTYRRYMTCGILKDIGYPLIRIKNDTLSYTYEVKSSKYRDIEYYGENNKKADTIWIYDTLTQYVKFRQSSIDSIIKTVKPKHDTMISSLWFSPGDFDTRIIGMKFDGVKEFKIKLVNTFDSNAIEIVNIINTYLPLEYKIGIPYTEWQRDINYRKNRKFR
jgi:hypothetical protein